jgi:hypothetical protein
VFVPLNLKCELDEIDFASFNKLQIAVVVYAEQSYNPQLILQLNDLIWLLRGTETMDHHHQFVRYLLEEVAVEYLLAKDSVGLLFRSGSVGGVDLQIGVKQVKEDAVVLLFASIVGQKREQAVALAGDGDQQRFIHLIEKTNEVFMQFFVLVAYEQDL